MSRGILFYFKPILFYIYNKTAVCSNIIISCIKLLYHKHLHLQYSKYLKFSSPQNIILICPKILKHISKEIDSSLVVVEEYIPFLLNSSK